MASCGFNYPELQGCNCLQTWHVIGDPRMLELRLPRRGGNHDVPKPLLSSAFHHRWQWIPPEFTYMYRLPYKGIYPTKPTVPEPETYIAKKIFRK